MGNGTIVVGELLIVNDDGQLVLFIILYMWHNQHMYRSSSDWPLAAVVLVAVKY